MSAKETAVQYEPRGGLLKIEPRKTPKLRVSKEGIQRIPPHPQLEE